jgi:hypothetical protein
MGGGIVECPNTFHDGNDIVEWNQYIALWSGKGRLSDDEFGITLQWKHKMVWVCNLSGPSMVKWIGHGMWVVVNGMYVMNTLQYQVGKNML